MIFDACAWAGRYPFAREPSASPEDLLRLMDEAGIDRALVSPLAGAFYKDCGEANREIADTVLAQPERLTMAPVINPCVPWWREDLQEAAGAMAAPAVRLLPAYHGCSVSDPRIGELVDNACDYALAVIVTLRLEDERGHPPAFRVPPASVTDTVRLAGEHPAATIVISMARYAEISALASEIAAAPPGLYVDVAGIQGPTMCMEKLASVIGVTRLLFATCIPLQYAIPAKLKVEVTDLDDEHRQALLAGNARAAFRRAADG